MSSDARTGPRRDLAFAILTKMPQFGIWAEAIREFETPYGTIGYRQAAILWAIRFQLVCPADMTPTGFAAFHRVQPSVITRALAKLEAAGFTTRSVDASDTRVSHIAITERGRAISEYIEQLYIDDLLAAIEPVPDADLAQLQSAVDRLDQIAQHLDRRRVARTRRAGAEEP